MQGTLTLSNKGLDSPFGNFQSAREKVPAVLCYVVLYVVPSRSVLCKCVWFMCAVLCLVRAVRVRGAGWALVATVGQQESPGRARRW